MRALITGSQGFVGKYLRRELEENGYEVLGIDLQAGPDTIQADLLAPEQMKEVVSQTKPNAVFHLAGQADVARSWKIPQKTMEINVIAAVNRIKDFDRGACNLLNSRTFPRSLHRKSRCKHANKYSCQDFRHCISFGRG